MAVALEMLKQIGSELNEKRIACYVIACKFLHDGMVLVSVYII